MKLTPLEEHERDMKVARRIFLVLGGLGISAILLILLWMAIHHGT
jgi:hypothetical protein